MSSTKPTAPQTPANPVKIEKGGGVATTPRVVPLVAPPSPSKQIRTDGGGVGMGVRTLVHQGSGPQSGAGVGAAPRVVTPAVASGQSVQGGAGAPVQVIAPVPIKAPQNGK